MLRIATILAFAVVGLLVIDRALLWVEAKGWIYYRRNKPRGHASVYHFMEMSAVFNPSFKEVIEIQVEEREQENEDGELLRKSLPQIERDDGA